MFDPFGPIKFIFGPLGGIIQRTLFPFWWIVLPPILFYFFQKLWVDRIQDKYLDTVDWVLLEIRIPKDVEKSLKSTEQIFAGLHGIHRTNNFIENYFQGKVQLWFSLEIVGRNGEIHFFIHTPRRFRDLVEAQVYAQYPDAEIAEVDDYTKDLPSDFDLWGTEFKLIKSDPYPIRTYPYFEKEGEERVVDPLASLTEILSHLKEGEQVWIQILVTPAGSEWKDEGGRIVAKLMGRKVKAPRLSLKLFLEKPLYASLVLIDYFLNSVVNTISEVGKPTQPPSWAEEKKKAALGEAFPEMALLSPGEREIVSAIENNISKLGFKTTIRFLYLAQLDTFSKANVSAVLGAFKQFNTLNLNGFKPNKKITTDIDYVLKRYRDYKRKKALMEYYKKRKPRKRFQFVFNTEELASIYHYPGLIVAAPMMPRIEARKGEPPVGLPVE